MQEWSLQVVYLFCCFCSLHLQHPVDKKNRERGSMTLLAFVWLELQFDDGVGVF